MNDPLWYKDAIFYELYPRAFFDSNGDGHGDLRGILEKLDYLQELGVDCLWLLPIFESPLVDDGYDVSDFYNIQKRFGTVADFKALIRSAHERGIKIIADLVMNHTSDQHPWFIESRASINSPMRDYYIWNSDDQKFRDARIIFIDSQKSNWQFDPLTQEYYFHRFFQQQPDLNYNNHAVQNEMFAIIKFWLDLGLDGFRCDAVPYLFKREGTSCENLPEMHAYMKSIRHFIDENYPGKLLLAEANQPHAETCEYFGDGDEFQMGFHFPLMPQIFIALKKQEAQPIEHILNHALPIPSSARWGIFLRNHDELTLEMVTPEEREFMWREYAPEPRMRLNLGIRRRLAPLLDNDLGKILLAHSLLLTLPGSPILYYGDEIEMGDDIWLKDRDGVRTPMQWSDAPNAGFSSADTEKLYAPVIDNEMFGYRRVNVEAQRRDPNSLLNALKKMIAVRKQHRAFGRGVLEVVETNNRAVLAYVWQFEDETIFIANNLSALHQAFSFQLTYWAGHRPVDLLTGKKFPQITKDYLIELEPHEFLWLVANE